MVGETGEEKPGFKPRLWEEEEDDMVNVNAQVSSSMELPFGEHVHFFPPFLVCVCV